SNGSTCRRRFRSSSISRPGLLFGSFPAWLATRPGLLSLVRAGGSTERRTTSRARALFVGAQVSFSVLLLVVAGLFQQTLRHAAAAPPGFDREGLSVTQVDLSLLGYDAPRARAAFDRLTERLRSLPGVEAAAVSSSLPLGLGHRTANVGLPGSAAAARISADTAEVDDGYFSTMRISLLRGRGFASQDVPGAPVVAVVNEALARRLWPGRDPIGRTIADEDGAISIVGLARDGKYRQLWESPRPFLYLASRQSRRLRRELVVRSGMPPAALAAVIRRELRTLDPVIPFSEIMPIARFIGFSTLPQRAAGAISGALGGLGLLVTAIGLAGLVAYSVSRRTREIGLRLAVGARPRDVSTLEIRRAAIVAAIGFAPGAGAAILVTPLLRRFLFGVGAADPATFGTVALLLGTTTFLASWLPARRAARLDPLAALRTDG
ncbi:MAG: FtsX-like permease family protein, partial [Acidobacteriota bacterium]